MPSFEKSPAELEAFYRDVMADFPQVTMRKTFGYLSAYMYEHMATSLFANFMILRLNPQDEAEFLKLPGAASFAPMRPDRPMKGFVMVPESVRAARPLLNSWIVRSLEHAGSLPPKTRKTKKS